LDLKLFASAFIITFLAELPDKTAFASFVLSTRKKPLAVFAGGATAMVIHSAIAVGLGSLLGRLPTDMVRLFAGGVFLVFAFLIWRREAEEEAQSAAAQEHPESFFGVAVAAFLVIFVAEWGDLTQFSTAALAAKTLSPWTIFAAAVLGLWCAIGLAGWLGKKAGTAFDQRVLQRVAAGAFACVGCWILLT
jgi:putative Ca2+/H+ antiporter (TMEM165/GDT1 family)